MEAQDNLTTDVSWDAVQPPLNPKIIEILKSREFTKLTPVQVHTLPLFLKHKDVAVQACTGSGKTLAFVIPLMEMILRVLSQDTVFLPLSAAAMIITPTRGLAVQIKQIVDWFTEPFNMECILVIGGATIEETQARLSEYSTSPKKALIIVGTPGRIEASLYNSPPLFGTRQLEVLVIDEADRILDFGFQASQGLFSATQTKELIQLIRAGLRNPVQVNVTVNTQQLDQQNTQTQITPASLKNYYYICPPEHKINQLVRFLKANRNELIIVYFLTCAQVNYFWKVISSLNTMKGIKLTSLHGKIPQEQREKVYNAFIQQKEGVLFTTDIAARGLDFPNIDLVLQFDPPQSPDQFVHRVGRTARMGKCGTAVVFLTPDQDTYIQFLKHRAIPIEELVYVDVEEDVMEEIREQAKKERETFDKGQLAFVSFIRAYKGHSCNYIFRLAAVDLGHLANGFGLLTLPKMPELQNPKSTQNFIRTDINLETIRFKDKKREKIRLKKLEEHKKKLKERDARTKPVKVIKKSESWSVKQRHKALKGGFDVLSSIDANEETNDWEDDWAEINQEKSLRKKLRKRKISQKEYAKQMAKIDIEKLRETLSDIVAKPKENA